MGVGTTCTLTTACFAPFRTESGGLMKRAEGLLNTGDRCLLQYSDGTEVLVDVKSYKPLPGGTGFEAEFRAVAGDEIPESVVREIWLLEPGDRVVRDRRGHYWLLKSDLDRVSGSGSPPLGWRVEFVRHDLEGREVRYWNTASEDLLAAPDARVLRSLEHARRLMNTDDVERLLRLLES